MARLWAVDPDHAAGETKQLLESVQAKLSMTPNLIRTLANSAAALRGFLALNQALADGRLSPRLREQLALTTSEANGSDYCLAAHTASGKVAGLSDDEVGDGRAGVSPVSRVHAALRFARQVVRTRGNVADWELENLRQAGYDDGQIAEIVANVALSIFANYTSQIAQTEPDCPRVPDLVTI